MNVVYVILGVALLALATDAGYALVVRWRMNAWERGVRRGADGVREGCEAFNLGEGRVALLMVHGFGSSPAVYARMASSLAGRGYACRGMRLPGYGEPAEKYARATRLDWERAFLEELAALRATHDRIWIVAHSMGATLTVKVLRNHPGAADGLILISPLFRVCSKRSVGLRPDVLFRFIHLTLRFSHVFELCFPVDAADPELAGLEGRDVFVPRSAYAELFKLVDEVAAGKQAIQVPLLMIVTRADKVVDYRAAEAFFAGAPEPKKILYADPAGHVIPLDHGWTEAVRAVDDFIFSHEPQQ